MDIQHTQEFTHVAGTAPMPQRLADEARELAAAYSRLFSTDDGLRVLADLLIKFDPATPRFSQHESIVKAAVIDGRSDVVRDILSAIKAGTPITGISPKTPHP